MNVDTDVLRSFIVLAEELHFARAADRLYVEQPALSYRIKRLERLLGIELFIRDTRNVRLTPAGVAFRADVIDVLERLDSAIVHAREVDEGQRGSVHVVYTLSVGYEILSILLDRLQTLKPDLQVDALEMWEKDVLEHLRRRIGDVGIVRGEPDDPTMDAVLVQQEPLLLAVAQDHHLAGRDSVRMAELKDEHFVIMPSRLAPGYVRHIEKVFSTAGFAPRAVINPVPGSRVMAYLQRNNDAVALLPASARQAYPEGIATFVAIEDDFARMPLHLVHRKSPDPAVKSFVEVVQELSRERGWLGDEAAAKRTDGTAGRRSPAQAA